MELEVEPLVEFNTPVTLPFRNRTVPALRDKNSGYIFFEPPPAEELAQFYQAEYASKQGDDYYNVAADYDRGKNCYHAERMLSTFSLVNKRAPADSVELGCAYGGLVWEMSSRGIDARGFDIGADAVSKGRKLKGNDRIFQASNLSALDEIKKPVDLIYSLGVLEHDPAMIDVIAKSVHHLTDTGLFYALVPNAMFINSIIGGFRNNFWAAYPDHLHMLTPGFLLKLCDETGFEPVFWDTNVFFHAGQKIDGLTGDVMSDSKKLRWELALGLGGYGMALNFALTPKFGRMAFDHRERIAEIRRVLEDFRQREVNIRDALKGASF